MTVVHLDLMQTIFKRILQLVPTSTTRSKYMNNGTALRRSILINIGTHVGPLEPTQPNLHGPINNITTRKKKKNPQKTHTFIQRSVRRSVPIQIIAVQIARTRLNWPTIKRGPTTCLGQITIIADSIEAKFHLNHTRGRNRTNSLSCKVTDMWLREKPLLISLVL